MKFEWKIEDLKYMNMTSKDFDAISKSGEYSLQEMQDAMDEYGNYTKWSLIWEKYELFQREKNTIKIQKNSYGSYIPYNTNSLNAWCRKNGIPQSGYSTSAGYYKFGFNGVSITTESRERILESVPYIFAKFLEFLKLKEKEWFHDHDEYSLKLDKIRDNIDNKHLPLPFEGKYAYSFFFDGTIIDSKTKKCRTLTLDELNKIIIFQNAVETAIKNVFDTQNPMITI